MLALQQQQQSCSSAVYVHGFFTSITDDLIPNAILLSSLFTQALSGIFFASRECAVAIMTSYQYMQKFFDLSMIIKLGSKIT